MSNAATLYRWLLVIHEDLIGVVVVFDIMLYVRQCTLYVDILISLLCVIFSYVTEGDPSEF